MDVEEVLNHVQTYIEETVKEKDPIDPIGEFFDHPRFVEQVFRLSRTDPVLALSLIANPIAIQGLITYAMLVGIEIGRQQVMDEFLKERLEG